MNERNYSEQTGFASYTYTDRETGADFTSPFPVAVFGIKNELLGVGTVIGSITDDDWDAMPVIAIQDKEETIEILGAECWWSCPLDNEMVELLATDNMAKSMVRATTYVQLLDSRQY